MSVGVSQKSSLRRFSPFALIARSRLLPHALIPIWALYVGTAPEPVALTPSLKACQVEAQWYLTTQKYKRIACVSGKTVARFDAQLLPKNLRKGKK